MEVRLSLRFCFSFRELTTDACICVSGLLGNYAWGSESVTRKTRIISVVYNASNNELVRTNTLVKGAVVQVDATPFRQWYEAHVSSHFCPSKLPVSVKNKHGLTFFFFGYSTIPGIPRHRIAGFRRTLVRPAHLQKSRCTRCCHDYRRRPERPRGGEEEVEPRDPEAGGEKEGQQA